MQEARSAEKLFRLVVVLAGLRLRIEWLRSPPPEIDVLKQ
jgi:hypothetical protein